MSYRVLVVDDTNFMRKMAADCLRQQGYEVAGEAANGREAVKLYGELRPDIVLMDLTMPEMNGIDAIKEILKLNPDAVILICSASNQQELIFKALDAGAKGYIMKPFNPDRLYDTIRKYAEPHLIGAHGAAEATAEAQLEETHEAQLEEQHEELAAALAETEYETDAEPPSGAMEQEEIAWQRDPLDDEVVAPAEAASPLPDPANVIMPAMRSDRVRSFTSSHVCSWQDELHGETASYTVTYTTNENNILIELTRPNQAKQIIPFPLDGFRLLSSWLEDHAGGI